MPIEQVKRKSGIRFRARFSIGNTPFRSPWFGTRSEAKEWEAKKRTEVAEGRALVGAAMPLSQFASIWLERHAYVRKTYTAALRDEQYLRKYILSKLGHRKLYSLTSYDFTMLFSDLERAGTVSPKTLNNCLGTVKKMLSDGVSWGMLSHNPSSPVPRFRIHKDEVTIFTHSEISALLSFAHEKYPEEYNLIVFALNTGCRLGECCSLSWAKVDLDSKSVIISATYDEKKKVVVPRTKGKRFRKVPLNRECVELLRRLHLEGRKNESEVSGRGNTFKVSDPANISQRALPFPMRPDRSLAFLRDWH